MLDQLTQIQEDRLKHLLASLESSVFRFSLSSLISVFPAEDSLTISPTESMGEDPMTETVVDQRGRVLIPEEIRESAGLKSGAMVAIEKARDIVVNQATRETEERVETIVCAGS